MLRVTPVSSCYAKRGIVQQNLLAALRRPLFVGVFPDAVPVDHYEHGHPLAGTDRACGTAACTSAPPRPYPSPTPGIE